MNKSRLLPKDEKKELQEVPNILAISATSPATGVYLAWMGSWWTSTICMTWWLQRIRESGVTCCGRKRKHAAHITDTRESKKQKPPKKKPASLLLFFSGSVVSDSLWPQGLQHPRLPCPSLSPGACSNSCPVSQWCHPAITSSVIPFSSCLQSFPASGPFPMSRLSAPSGQNIGASASASVLPMSTQGWFPLGLTGLISLQSKRLTRIFSNNTV